MNELKDFTDWFNDQEPIDSDGVGDYSATEGAMFQWMIDEVERLMVVESAAVDLANSVLAITPKG